MVNGGVSPAQNVLVTGAGGGVAAIAIQLCMAKGANVYVTSGSDEKIRNAVQSGVKGGVNYKSSWYPSRLALRYDRLLVITYRGLAYAAREAAQQRQEWNGQDRRGHRFWRRRPTNDSS